jgi:uncharacterized protein (TIGR01655 family)
MKKERRITMETIKEKIIVIIGIVLVIALCCGAYYMLVYQSSDYYTQIDNTKVEKISKHNMNYEYTLISYNKNGKSKEITFQTTRELREDAYLKLKVMMTRGVVNWEEVQFDEMPETVQEQYNK